MPTLGLLERLVHSISKSRSKSKGQEPSHNQQPTLAVSHPMPLEHAVPDGASMALVAASSVAQAQSSSPAEGRSHNSHLPQVLQGGPTEQQPALSEVGDSPDRCARGGVQPEQPPATPSPAAPSPAICPPTPHPAQHNSCDPAPASQPPSSRQPAALAPRTSAAPIPAPVRTPYPALPPTSAAPASTRSHVLWDLGSQASSCSAARNAVHSSNDPAAAHHPQDGLEAARFSTLMVPSQPSQELDTLLPSSTATLAHAAAGHPSPYVGADDDGNGAIMDLPNTRPRHHSGRHVGNGQQGLPCRYADGGGMAAAAAAVGAGADGSLFGTPVRLQHHQFHSPWGKGQPCADSGPLGRHEALELSRELHASLSALRGGSSSGMLLQYRTRRHEPEQQRQQQQQQQQDAREPWVALLSAASAAGNRGVHASGPKRHTVHGVLGWAQDRGAEGLSGPLQGTERCSSSLAGAHPDILTLMSVAPKLRQQPQQQQPWGAVGDGGEVGLAASGPTAKGVDLGGPVAGEACATGSNAATCSVPGMAAGTRPPATATGTTGLASTVGGPAPGQQTSSAAALAAEAAAAAATAAEFSPVAAAAPAAPAAPEAEPADQCTMPTCTTACRLAGAGPAAAPVAAAAAAGAPGSPEDPEKPDGAFFISSSTIQEYSQAAASHPDTPGYYHCDITTNSDAAGSAQRAVVAQDLTTAEGALNTYGGGGDPPNPSPRTSYAERMDVLRLTHVESFSGIGVVNFLGCFDDSSFVTVKLTEIPQGLGLPPSAFSAACSSSNPGQQLTVPEGPSTMDRHPVSAALSASVPASGAPSCPYCSMPTRRRTQGRRRVSTLSTASSGSDSGSNDCVAARVSACDTDRSGCCCCAGSRRTEGGRDTGHGSVGEGGTGDAGSETWFHDQCREALQSATEIGVLTALNHPNIVQAFCYHPGVVLQDAGRDASGAQQQQQQQPASSGTTFFLRPATAQDYEQPPADASTPAGSGGGDGGAVRSPVCMALCCEWCDLGSLQQAAAAGRFAAQQGPSGDSGSSRGGGGSSGSGGFSGSISGDSRSGAGDGVPRSSDSGSYYSDTDWESLLYTLLDVAVALRYLHAAGLVHRAVEPAAVLLRSEPSDPRGFVAKLASFGLATRGNAVPPPSTTSSPVAPGAAAAAAAAGGSARPSASSVGSAPLHDGAAAAAALTPPLASGGLVGPVHCIPPEAYYGAGPTSAGDVWAFGMLMWSLACGGGARPYCGAPPQSVPQLVVRGSRPAFDDRVPLAYRTLATQCWSASPGSRPTSAQLVVRLRRMVQEYGTQ